MIATITLNPALDKSIYVERLLPNDTNRILRVETDAGGKGINASRVLKELGDETVALGFLGGDTGSYIEHVLISSGIATDFVHIDSNTRTNIAIQEESGLPPTSLNESGPNITEDELNELFAKVQRVARKSSMVIIGGSLTSGVPSDTYKKLVQLIKSAGAKAILDADGEPMRLGMEARPFMIKPNRDEVRRLIGVDIASPNDAARAANILAEKGIELVVISMGAKGAVARSSEGAWYVTSPDIRPVSTIGSGDSMVAGIAYILSQGKSLQEALIWGTAAGTATAMTDGTEICKRHQILQLLNEVHVQQL